MRILSIVGTRPELIKTLAFTEAAKKARGLEFLVAHSAQNFQPEMSDNIAHELGVPLADRNAAVDRSTSGSTAKSLIDYSLGMIDRFKPDIVLSNTDTHTAFYCALASSFKRVRVAHIEGGIRCEARLNPEEINRRLADHLSTWVFTISEEDSDSLKAEGFPGKAVFNHGDITLDALQIVLERNGIRPKRGDYDLLTTHRQENADDPRRLSRILEGVHRGGFRTVFAVHLRTQATLERSGLLKDLSGMKNIELKGPQTYVDMLKLAAGCRKLLSDSGGLRREGFMLKKPVISLVPFVWFKQMNRLGFEKVVDADTERLAAAIRDFDPPEERPALFGDGQAASRILGTLMSAGA